MQIVTHLRQMHAAGEKYAGINVKKVRACTMRACDRVCLRACVCVWMGVWVGVGVDVQSG